MVKLCATKQSWYVLVFVGDFFSKEISSENSKQNTPSQTIYGEGYFSEYSRVNGMYNSCSNTLVRYKRGY
mgnify:CR=1 FL=1